MAQNVTNEYNQICFLSKGLKRTLKIECGNQCLNILMLFVIPWLSKVMLSYSKGPESVWVLIKTHRLCATLLFSDIFDSSQRVSFQKL